MPSDEHSITTDGPAGQVRVRQVRPPDETVTFTAGDPIDIFTAAGKWLSNRHQAAGTPWNVSYADYDYGPRPIFSTDGSVTHRVEHILTLHIERFDPPLSG